MVKNEEMHYIDSDDQEESTRGKKPDNKWAIKIFFSAEFIYARFIAIYAKFS